MDFSLLLKNLLDVYFWMVVYYKIGSKEELSSFGMVGMVRMGDLSVKIVPHNLLFFQLLQLLVVVLHHSSAVIVLKLA